jgi:hypothetical protein
LDLIIGLLVGMVRDLLIQGTGGGIVHLVWRGRVVPDVWSSKAKANGIVSEGMFFYRLDGVRHMYAGPVFGIGFLFWVVVAIGVVAYVKFSP